MMLAAMLAQPAIQLSQDEARGIAAAASNVSRHYDMRTSQKALDWGMLGVTLVGVYGPRIAVIVSQRRAAGQGSGIRDQGSVPQAAAPAASASRNGAAAPNGGASAWSAADPFA